MNTARVPPHDLGAERHVLGSSLLDGDCRKELMEMLVASAFYSDAHAKIWEAMIAVEKQGHGCDVIGIRGQLGSKLEGVGGDEYLLALTDVIPTVSEATKHAARIQKLATVRAHIFRAMEIASSGYQAAEGDLDEWLDNTERMISDMPTRRGATQAIPYDQVIGKTYDGIQAQAESGSTLAGIAIGITKYDEHTQGHSKGHLVIIAGRPGMGKSALAEGAVDHAAEQGIVSAVFSLEMTDEQWGRRHLSSRSGIDGRRLRAAHTLGRDGRDDWPRLSTAAGELANLPIHFWDKPDTTINEIRTECRRIDREEKRKGNEDGLGLVVVDYLQLLKTKGKSRSREEEVSQFSRELKNLAKELQLPVIALAQLNRDCEKRNDKRPMLSDLRESGAIEQDADTIVFVYRDEVYNPFDPDANPPMRDLRGVAELIFAKNREGGIGMVKCAWIAPLTKFADLEDQYGYENDGPPTDWHDQQP